MQRNALKALDRMRHGDIAGRVVLRSGESA
jgi:hypothetical protein